MQQLEAMRKKIATTRDLLSVVKTMKALAAVNIRHFESAAKGVGEYAEVIEQGWTVFFRNAGIRITSYNVCYTKLLRNSVQSRTSPSRFPAVLYPRKFS